MNYFKVDEESPSLQNWLGQQIHVGSWVYRGARDGNTSSFKVGQVTKLHDNNKVTVQYYAENEYRAHFGKLSMGRPSVDSVVLIDLNTFASDVKIAIADA